MTCRLREDIHHHNASDDETDAEDGGGVQFLAVHQPGHDGNQYDADSGPDGVGEADGKGPQGKRQKIKCHAIPNNDDDRRGQFRETVRQFLKRRGDHFGDDGDG